MHVLLAATESHSEGGLASLGLNLSGLIFQLINFLILFWVLRRFVFPAIVSMLERRRAAIAAGLKEAEAAKRAHAEAEVERQKVLQQARSEAGELVESARVEAKREAERIVREAQAAAAAKVTAAEQRIDRERREAKAELMNELGGVVAQATAAVTRDELTLKADAAVIQKALKEATQ